MLGRPAQALTLTLTLALALTLTLILTLTMTTDPNPNQVTPPKAAADGEDVTPQVSTRVGRQVVSA